jgi:sulfite reductase (NADPH) flavoprotein alpha-component
MTVARKPLLILFGSQTGTAETLAKRLAKEAERNDLSPRALSMEKYASIDWAAEENLLIITSTYGEGEPPDNALAFWQHLNSDAAPKLSHLKYSVLALGDSNYADFCKFGIDCDARLEALGAHRILPRVDCDLEYEKPSAAWAAAVFSHFAAAPVPQLENASPESTPIEPLGSKKNPYPARLLTNRLLNAPGSAKEVRHFEISLENCEVPYEAGDALGVIPQNCPELVQDILDALGCDGEEAVPLPDGGETSLRMALLESYEITKPSPAFLTYAAQHHLELATLLEPTRKDDLQKHLWGREIIDFLTEPIPLAEFIPLLKRLQPRLYSISSSPKAHPKEVHLTISSVRHDSHNRPRKGVCSTFLADRCHPHMPVRVFVQTSHGFRVPSDLTKPIIMVGPGTGIAPFRAFLQERRATGATGKNWLFFGDQKRSIDFLYEEELTTMHAEGHLHRLDLAFSRDQTEKVYVQTRMMAAGEELWSWLESGAHFYVCGDASRMAKDVDATLHAIVEKFGGKTPEAAREYIGRLKADKRYQRDVY